MKKRTPFAVLLAACVLAQAPSFARADGTPPASAPPPSDATLAKAKEFFDAGAREYEAGHFDDAIQLFEQAYKVAPRDGIVFSMAQAHRRQYTIANDSKHLLRAVELYEKYLTLVPTGGRRNEAAQALGELKLMMQGKDMSAAASAPSSEKPKTRLVVNIFVPGTRVSIDHGASRSAPLNDDIPPGQHTVKLEAPGYFDVERAITIDEGQIASANLEQKEKPGKLVIHATNGAEVSVDGRFISEAPIQRPIELASGRHFVSLAKNGHEALALDVDVARDKEKKLDFSLRTTSQRDASYAILIGGGALLATGAVFTGLVVSKQSTAASIHDKAGHETLQPSDVDDYDAARASRDRFTAAAVGTGTGGAVLELVGLALFLFDKPRPVAAPAIETAPDKETPTPGKDTPLEMSFAPRGGPSGGSLSWQLRF